MLKFTIIPGFLCDKLNNYLMFYNKSCMHRLIVLLFEDHFGGRELKPGEIPSAPPPPLYTPLRYV